VSSSALTDLSFSGQPLPEAPALKLAELVRLQKFAERITSTLEIEELIPRIVDEVAESLGFGECAAAPFMAQVIASKWGREW
jgi:hypothetical protein